MMTLTEVLNKYEAAKEFYLGEIKAHHRSNHTLRSYDLSLRKFGDFFAKAHAGEDEVNDPSYLDFRAWRDEMEENGVTVGSIERYMLNVRQFFNFVSDESLGEMRFYERNPLPVRVVPSNAKERAKPYQEILSDEAVSKLWKNEKFTAGKGKKTGKWARNYAIVMVLLATEIRNKELLDLKLSDVDFEYGEIQVMAGKGNKYRCVDCPEIALTAIKLYLESGERPSYLTEDDYLFGNNRPKGTFGRAADNEQEWNRGSRQWLSKLVEGHVKEITGVAGISSHDLRHVGARLDLHNGMSVEELQAKLGHSSPNTTQIYSGKLGTNRKRVTAMGVYEERDLQAARNKMMLGA